MRQRHPATVLLVCWLVFILLVVAADCLLKPAPVVVTEVPTPTWTRIPMVTVTPAPSQTVFVFAPIAPESPVVLDALPMSTATPPANTRVLEPTATPTATPSPNTTPPTQKG